LPFPDERFDLVMSLVDIADAEQAIAEIQVRWNLIDRQLDQLFFCSSTRLGTRRYREGYSLLTSRQLPRRTN